MTKKSLISIFFFLGFFFAVPTSAQPYTPGETLNPACAPGAVDCNVTTLTAQDEGVDLGGNVLTLNFTGAGITSSILSGVVTVNVPAGWEVTGSDIFYDGGSVAIGTDTPVSSAILTLSSSTKGLLIPTNADPDTNITSPVDGLIAYDTTDDQFRGYVDGAWENLEKFQTTTVHVTSAEILSLQSSPKELLPAPGAGKYYNILSVKVKYNFVTGAYLSGNLRLIQGDGSFPIFGDTTSLLASTVDKLASFTPLSGRFLENNKVELINLSGNPTTGLGSLDVHIYYTIENGF